MIVYIYIFIIVKMGKTYSIDYEMPEYIVEHITDNLIDANIANGDDYYDELHSIIDDWIVGSTGEAREIVDDFGVLKAIRLYQEDYGEFILDEDDDKVYMSLSYCIIKNWFDNNYSFDELSKK